MSVFLRPSFRRGRGVAGEARQTQQVVSESAFSPDQAWTLDICETPKGLRVVEVGAFSTSSLYRCDWTAVEQKASAAAQRA